MNDNQKAYRRAVRTQTTVCGLLFFVFSVTYLYVFERDVIEALHFSLAHGMTHYAPLPSAIVISAVLIILRWAVGYLLGLRGRIRALAYFPSFLILGALTDVGRGVYMSDYHTRWLWLLPLLLAVYSLAVIGVKNLLRSLQIEHSQPFALMNSNVAIIILLSAMTVAIGNTDAGFHHEVAVEHHILAGEYDKALETGRGCQEASRTLTALRAYAMSRQGTMGEKLFEYPQHYRSEGLFFFEDSLLTFRYTNDSIFALVGVRPTDDKLTPEFLRRVCYDGSAKFTALDYYFSSLLLEKSLGTFANAVSDLIFDADSLPKHYQEALAMYQTQNPDAEPFLTDSTQLRRYAAYKAALDNLHQHPETLRDVRKEYGKTWWWYVNFQ